MPLETIKDSAYIISSLLAIGAMVYSWLASRSKANSAALTTLDHRVTKTEIEIKHLSGISSEIKTVHNRIDDVANTTANIEGQMTQLNGTLSIIQKHLIDD